MLTSSAQTFYTFKSSKTLHDIFELMSSFQVLVCFFLMCKTIWSKKPLWLVVWKPMAPSFVMQKINTTMGVLDRGMSNTPTQDAQQQQADGWNMVKPATSKQRRWFRATSPGDQWVSGSGPSSSLAVFFLRTINGWKRELAMWLLDLVGVWSSLADVTHQF